MTRHVMETDLALYAAGDLPFWRSAVVRLHVRRCDECRGLVEALRADREELRRSADGMPASVDWDQLAAEMTANIRVGLAAGECVTPRERKVAAISWRPVAIAAGLVVLLAGAWWLNIPRTDTETIGRALRDMATEDGCVPSRKIVVRWCEHLPRESSCSKTAGRWGSSRAGCSR